MATLVQSPLIGKKVLYVKGAPEIVLGKCKDVMLDQRADIQNFIPISPVHALGREAALCHGEIPSKAAAGKAAAVQRTKMCIRDRAQPVHESGGVSVPGHLRILCGRHRVQHGCQDIRLSLIHILRRVKDMFSGVRFSRQRRCEPLPVVVYAHKSLIRRTLGTCLLYTSRCV